MKPGHEIALSLADDPGYARLKEQIIACTGLAYFEDRDSHLTNAIGKRLSELGIHDCRSYSDLLERGAEGRAELDVLIDHLTIGETYFFRDADQFAAIGDVILPEILKRKQSSRRLRIWSAGCATGAEPYSLAMVLARQLGAWVGGWDVSICATDLNRSYLAKAAEGKFTESALRSTSDEVKLECFSKEGQTWTIHPRYKRWISFQRLNLIEETFPSASAGIADFDLILCRNVTIYFAPATTRRLIGQLAASLADDGWLVVGAVEQNQEDFAAFRAVNTPGATVYQKMASPRAENERAPEPPPLPRAAREAAGPIPADLEGLRQLADRGDWQRALPYCQRLLAQDGLNPAVHFYHALVLDQVGTVEELEQALRKAIYLDRNFAMAHYHLGLIYKKERKTRPAARSFNNVIRALSGIPDGQIVTAGPGVTANRLKELAKMHLEGSGGS